MIEFWFSPERVLRVDSTPKALGLSFAILLLSYPPHLVSALVPEGESPWFAWVADGWAIFVFLIALWLPLAYWIRTRELAFQAVAVAFTYAVLGGLVLSLSTHAWSFGALAGWPPHALDAFDCSIGFRCRA